MEIKYSKTDARKNPPEIVNKVKDGEGPVYITSRNDVEAVVISYEEYMALKGTDIQKSPLYGLWKDKKDIKDSVEWVNKFRENDEEILGRRD